MMPQLKKVNFELERQLDEEHKREADLLFERLLALDPNRLAREELAAAGISQHRIEALYPYDFADLIPAIKAAVTEDFLDELDPDDGYWNALHESVRGHLNQYSAQVQEAARADIQVFIESQRPAYDDLHAHIHDRLPNSCNPHLGATTMLYALLNTCWLTNRSRRPETQRKLSYRRAHKLFVSTVKGTLPQLAADITA